MATVLPPGISPTDVPPVLHVPDADARIRRYNRETGRRLAVLDDDPTGSQAVHGVSVVTVLERPEYRDGLAQPGDTCFVLTNSRSVDERRAVALNHAVARDVYALAADFGSPIDLVSRGDSTLRGHVVAEVGALAAEHRAATGRPVDGVLFCPAMLSAGRFTVDDMHYAVVAGVPTPIGETEFARDRTFGYTRSNLREYLAELSGGSIAAADVASLSLVDIRVGGPDRVGAILSGISGTAATSSGAATSSTAARGPRWVVVNAADEADLDVVALGLRTAREAGRTFLVRSGPSFVRALAGIEPRPPLTARDIPIDPGGTRHGLIVAGSHVGLTTRQIRALRERPGLTSLELEVPALLDPERAGRHVDRVSRQLIAGLETGDVLVATSRDLVAVDGDPSASLDIARRVSTALVDVVRAARVAGPGWVIAKGGITAHDIAVRALGIRRAVVAGQFLPGQVSLFLPVAAPADVLGRPYVVFPGNVGADGTLAEVRDRMNGG